jgi:tRNA-Thr(GGU) m(6)t(6)A37 methyltransferase TsaA
MNYEQALRDLDGFERIWLLFVFHHNSKWRPTTQPPGCPHRVGLFASRSPYRPNPIGLSCVRLVGIDGLRVTIAQHDLLDRTPILDIKPYLPYADAFPGARAGWTETLDRPRFSLAISPHARMQLDLLASLGTDLMPSIYTQLAHDPIDTRGKRIEIVSSGGDVIRCILSVRTWRVHYDCSPKDSTVSVNAITSGYPVSDLDPSSPDPYGDKELHRQFVSVRK